MIVVLTRACLARVTWTGIRKVTWSIVYLSYCSPAKVSTNIAFVVQRKLSGQKLDWLQHFLQNFQYLAVTNQTFVQMIQIHRPSLQLKPMATCVSKQAKMYINQYILWDDFLYSSFKYKLKWFLKLSLYFTCRYLKKIYKKNSSLSKLVIL